MKKTNDTIIIIAGKGGTAFGKKDILNAVSGYMKHYKNVKLIGDGNKDLSLDKIQESLNDVKTKNFDVCIFAHGEKQSNGFNFKFGDDNYVHCKDLFDAINKITTKPVNLHIFSCHGGGALAEDYTKHLPNGSTAFSCCDYDNELPGTDVINFFKKLNSIELKDTSIETFLYLYLASMQNRNTIMLAKKNTRPINLLNCMLNVQGQPLSEIRINKIKSTIGPLFPPKILDTVIKKFAKDGEYNMYALEIGCAMAIVYLLYKNHLENLNYNRYPKPKRNHHPQIEMESFDMHMMHKKNKTI